MKHWRSGLTLALAGISLVPVVHEAISATYTASPSAAIPTSCLPGPGDFQSCLSAAADDPADDVIVLQPGNYSDVTYNYAPGTDDDSDDDGGALTISNESADLPVIDGLSSSKCLNISHGALPDDTGFNIVIDGVIFMNCTDSDGGALDVSTQFADVTVQNSSFFDNEAVDDDGGAILIEGGAGAIVVQNSIFESNTTSEDGSGVFLNSTGPISLLTSTFTDNSAGNTGGAGVIESTGSGLVTVQGNSFDRNQAGTGGSGDGGALRILGGDSAIIVGGNLFTNNSSSSDGGALDVFNNFEGPGSIVIVNNILAGNSNGSDPASTATSGGAISAFEVGTDLTVTNNTIVGNTSQSSDGTAVGGGIAIFLDSGSVANVYNNIIFGNSAEANGGDLYSDEDSFDDGGGTLNLFNNDFSGFYSEALDNGGAGTVNQGANIDADPLLADQAGGDFNLTASSPAIDVGDPNAPEMPATDFAGNPRPTIAGTNPDMGALEFQVEPPPSPTPTATPTPPIPPTGLLQGGCSLQVAAAANGAWLNGAWLLAIAGIALKRRR